jgi:hypothetical protein
MTKKSKRPIEISANGFRNRLDRWSKLREQRLAHPRTPTGQLDGTRLDRAREIFGPLQESESAAARVGKTKESQRGLRLWFEYREPRICFCLSVHSRLQT